MNFKQQSNPRQFHQITLHQKYNRCCIFDDLQSVILILASDGKVIITQASQTYWNIQFNIEYISHESSIRHRFHHQSINVWFCSFLNIVCVCIPVINGL